MFPDCHLVSIIFPLFVFKFPWGLYSLHRERQTQEPPSFPSPAFYPLLPTSFMLIGMCHFIWNHGMVWIGKNRVGKTPGCPSNLTWDNSILILHGQKFLPTLGSQIISLGFFHGKSGLQVGFLQEFLDQGRLCPAGLQERGTMESWDGAGFFLSLFRIPFVGGRQGWRQWEFLAAGPSLGELQLFYSSPELEYYQEYKGLTVSGSWM